MKNVAITKFPPLSYASDEAINTLCTNLTFFGANTRKIMLTSSHASEGKSFTSMNIMRTMAGLGKTVVLVDADLRRSRISSKFGLKFEGNPKEKQPGLAHYLASMVEMDDVIYKTDIEGAYIVPIGREVSNSLPLLSSPRFTALLDHLAANADYVIVDAPPVGTLIDAAQIARSCDGTLIVVSYNNVRRQELIDAKEQLEQTECPILGAVLSQMDYDSYLNKRYYKKGYYKGSYYSADPYDPAAKAAREEAAKGGKTK